MYRNNNGGNSDVIIQLSNNLSNQIQNIRKEISDNSEKSRLEIESKLKIINNDFFVGDKTKLTNQNISISKELSFTLNVNIGDKITLMSPSGVETIIGNLPKQKTFTLSLIHI